MPESLVTFVRNTQLFIVAVLVERSVETYLNATRQNGGPSTVAAAIETGSTPDASQPAMIAALVLSALAAMSGLRIIETLVTLGPNPAPLQAAIWNGVDIMISAGLMAGGADLFHKVANVLTTGLATLRETFSSKRPEAQLTGSLRELTMPYALVSPVLSAEAALAKTYTIHIDRPQGAQVETGTVRFSDGGVAIETACWWDKNNRIDAGTYLGCSKTTMASKGIDAVYLPGAISKVTGEKAIFIHHGWSPNNSLGCIAVTEAHFKTIYAQIQPANGRNVTVVIRDV